MCPGIPRFAWIRCPEATGLPEVLSNPVIIFLFLSQRTTHSSASIEAGYCTWILKNVTDLPHSILCPAWGQFHVLEIAGIVASSRADKEKWSFKFLNSSSQCCFVRALWTLCPASLPGLWPIWTMLKCHLPPAGFCCCKQLPAWLPQSLGDGMHAYTTHSQNTVKKPAGLSKICLPTV